MPPAPSGRKPSSRAPASSVDLLLNAKGERLGADDKQRLKAIAAKIIPQWVRAAPRASAKAYVAKVQALMPDTRITAVSLLFDTEPIELPVLVPGSLASFTFSQLHLPASTVVGRKGVDGRKLPFEPKQALVVNETLMLRGKPRFLAAVAVMHEGKIYIRSLRRLRRCG